MKKLILLLAVLSVGSIYADDKVVVPDSTGFKFTDVKLVPTTSVKDQNKSGTCWCFAGTSLLEDEILRKTGKEIDLSEMYTVRLCYGDKADRFVRMYGQANFGPGGSVVDVPYVYETYGIVPEEVYPGNNYGEDGHVHGELDRILSGYVQTVVSKPNKRISTAWRKGYEGILDAYLGELPETFVYEGVTYTPRSFADMLGLDMNDYVAFTSFTHHPFYKPFVLEVSDNWLWAPYQNVPMEELKAIVDNAIDKGYSVEWAADVSEGGFKWRQGYAVIPEETDEKSLDGTELARWVQLSDKDREESRFDIKGPVKEINVTQESRQEMFDRQETTDDHGMVIIGKAVDQDGNKYYKVKNSWNTNQLYNGYIYVSEPYFLAKTLSILVNKDAVPSSITSKLK
ncbi:MAG: aminopeptidase [Muribaculaceae bacterium]|nr:aminopeptidase [Muribaculaceae bacterium]